MGTAEAIDHLPSRSAKAAFASVIAVIGVAMLWDFSGLGIGPLRGSAHDMTIGKVLFDQSDGPTRVECGVFKGGAAFCRLILVGKGRPQRLDGVTSFANPGQHLDLVVMSMNQGKAAVAFASPDLKFGAVTVRLNQLLFAWASAKTGQEVAVTDPGQIEQAWQPLQCDHFKTALTFSGLFGNPDHPVCDLSGPDRSKTLDALEHGDNVALAIDSLVGQALFDLDGASFRRSERVFLRESAGRLPR